MSINAYGTLRSGNVTDGTASGTWHIELVRGKNGEWEFVKLAGPSGTSSGPSSR